MISFEKVAMQIISHAGEGKSKVHEAVEAYGNGDDAGFKNLMAEAEQEFTAAHKAQIGYLQEQIISSDANTPILIVHAMDILMTAMSERDMAMTLIAAFDKRRG